MPDAATAFPGSFDGKQITTAVSLRLLPLEMLDKGESFKNHEFRKKVPTHGKICPPQSHFEEFTHKPVVVSLSWRWWLSKESNKKRQCQIDPAFFLLWLNCVDLFFELPCFSSRINREHNSTETSLRIPEWTPTTFLSVLSTYFLCSLPPFPGFPWDFWGCLCCLRYSWCFWTSGLW